MEWEADVGRAIWRYLLSLATALLAAIIAIASVGGDAEPGTVSRAIVVLVFFTVFIGLLAKDDLVAFWNYLRE